MACAGESGRGGRNPGARNHRADGGRHGHPWLRGYINETDKPRVKIGAKARVTTDSPDKVYWGRVGFIADEAEFTPKQIQTSRSA